MSRANDIEDDSIGGANLSDEGNDEDIERPEDESGSDEESPAANSYSALLQTLNANKAQVETPRKRRKLKYGHRDADFSINLDEAVVTDDQVDREDDSARELLEDDPDGREVANEEDEGEEGEDPNSDNDIAADPFEKNFSNVDEQLLVAGIASMEANKVTTTRNTIAETSVTISSYASWPEHDRDVRDFMKKRLEDSAATVASKLVKLERHIASSVLSYKDVSCGIRNLHNAGHLRDLTALHALNHVFKTRDRVIKNNAKLSQQADNDTLDLRDQGFTRPKILIILPTRYACVKFIDSVVRLSEPDQLENKSRFTAGFAHQDDKTWDDKPEDFQDLFGGNDDDMFRLGLKFTRRTIKYFSSFYNSDIILASPLGLMRAIEGANGKDEKKKHDADFLSSIEIVIIDHTNALLMQNWQHVEYIFSQLNLLPKETRECDFSRVRNWYLEGQAKYLRQTIILSDYLSPEINSLASTHLRNIAGSVKYKSIYPGAMLKLPPTLPQGIFQTFTRISSPSPLTDADARFTHFTSTILPSILQSHQKQSTLIYLPTYTDFVRLRNHLSTSQTTASLSFGTISEYTSVRDVARARSHFLSGRHSVLLYTERAHHFRRYKIRGVKGVIFYGVPENLLFWGEVVGYLGLNEIDEKIGKSAVRAIFSKWDFLKLERIVGTERIGRLLSEKGGDTFEFR